jgi:LacI family transcriptional regulator
VKISGSTSVGKHNTLRAAFAFKAATQHIPSPRSVAARTKCSSTIIDAQTKVHTLIPSCPGSSVKSSVSILLDYCVENHYTERNRLRNRFLSMATIHEVAKKAKVSPSTVSHVINNTRFVSEALRQRVQQAMVDLNYRPNALARSLRLGQTHILGLVLPDSANPFFAEIGHAIESVAFEREYSVILCNTENDQTKELLYTNVLENRQVDGMILVATGRNYDVLSNIVCNGLPVVVVDRDLGSLGLDTVTTNNYLGGLLATRHLIELGHKIIGCITGPSDITPSAERVTGYCAALKAVHLDVDECLLLRGDFHVPSGLEAATRLLQQNPRPTALFVCNDMMAIGALQAAAKLGLRVPADVAIVGYDNIELASYTIPPLTTVSQPKQQIGHTAIQLVLERMSNPSLPSRHEILNPDLIIRESSRQSL